MKQWIALFAIGVGLLTSSTISQAYQGGYLPRYTSPPAKAAMSLDGKQITVDYYAPSMHGRKIIGHLVPYDTVWCTGANWATKLTTEADLDIAGLTVPKGSYSIWTIPDEKTWTLIINSQTGQFHLNYDKERDFGRVKMNVKAINPAVETFKIDLRTAGGDKGTLALVWENTEASVPISLLP